MRILDQLGDNRVHALGRTGGAGERRVLVEVRILNGTERHHAKLIGHTKARHHVTGELGGLLDIVGGAGRHLTKDELLGCTATAIDGELVQDLLTCGQEALILLDLHGVAQSTARARHDGDLGDRRRALLASGNDGMADLVIRNDLLLMVGQHRGLALLTGDDDLHRLLKIVLRSALAALTDGTQGALVDDIGQVSARGTGRGAGNRGQVDRRLRLHALGMQLENVLAAGQIGQLNGNAAVKTTGARQGRIEAVGTVGGSEDNDTLVVIEAIHLGQQLIERLLALVVAAKAAAVTLFADGIDLVDKHNARGLFLGLLKQVAHLGGATADEHLDELRTRNAKERNTSLAGNSLG